MNLSALYKKAISIGIESDPRGKDLVIREIERQKKEYEKLRDREKETFDIERLENPYPDSRILYGKGDEEIKTIFAGIDIEVGEVLLAETLRNKNISIDLLLSHHPEGRAYANLYSVMHMQADILHKFGVPISIAEDLLEERIREVERKLMPANHARAVDAARLLNIPFICLHAPSDNMAASYLQRLFDEREPYTVDDIVELLRELPEYREAEKNTGGPKILAGSKNRKSGKIFVDMTGGTEGSKEIFRNLSLSGISTIVAMHLSEDHWKEAKKNHLNVVIAGHIASDNLGLNLLFDRITTDDPLTILECSGFRRFSDRKTSYKAQDV
ncbi:NGG1p interacting factor NIF3 [Thermodesulfovibrionales bacterium]|nr:NGG1p interacting factor NIF3 [Thermodesulfovibrionales bacterium]MCL0067130.1 NGG1p interacting factor NIF3 [Thermodesulfovibrionales bacterium]MCL0072479.1 NGG1p interacting factor NIF3 [Thermodesulfovibrionales bacterium]MCL0096699.1 NGG1p interacting factor NIF3 [Thermodesulfovibrionales bacterium]